MHDDGDRRVLGAEQDLLGSVCALARGYDGGVCWAWLDAVLAAADVPVAAPPPPRPFLHRERP